MPEPETIRPIRIGVYETVASAEQAVASLKEAGFTDKEVSVLCSDKHQAQEFSDDLSEVENNSEAATAAIAGGALGSSLGGLMALAGLATVAGIPVIAAGAFAATLAGGVVGGLAGAMVERGFDKEPADYFDQAVTEGKILVSVEPADRDKQRLDQAAQILKDAGAEPISLLEG
ncbi:MAG: general stress protein [Lacipirellulaceae bacterium]